MQLPAHSLHVSRIRSALQQLFEHVAVMSRLWPRAEDDTLNDAFCLL